MPDRVQITGGAGFIGSVLTDYCMAQGQLARILDNLDPQVHPNGHPSYPSSDIDLHIVNVCNKQAVAVVLDSIDVVLEGIT